MRPASEVAGAVKASQIEILSRLLDKSEATPVMFGVPITKEFREGMRKLFEARDAEVRAAALEEAALEMACTVTPARTGAALADHIRALATRSTEEPAK